MTLDIKTQKRWKYNVKLCIGCGVNYETGEEILLWTGLETKQEKDDMVPRTLFYDLLISGKNKWDVRSGKNFNEKTKTERQIDGWRSRITSLDCAWMLAWQGTACSFIFELKIRYCYVWFCTDLIYINTDRNIDQMIIQGVNYLPSYFLSLF
jgi:hypothetical protein